MHADDETPGGAGATGAAAKAPPAQATGPSAEGDSAKAAAAPPQLASRKDFAAGVHWFVTAALQRGARTMWWMDPDFAQWPLSELDLLSSLTPWLRLPGRRLVLVAADWTLVAREQARFCSWRMPWSHAIETRRAQDEDAADVPTLLLDDGPLSVHLLDREHGRGRCSSDARDAYTLRHRFDALAQRSEPDFPPTKLGL
jgi:hypothetical protein